MAVEKLKGLDDVLKLLNKHIKELEIAGQNGLVEAGQLVRAEAQLKTPVVTGNLRNSAFLVWPRMKKGVTTGGFKGCGRFRGKDASKRKTEYDESVMAAKATVDAAIGPMVSVGFSTVYAISVHENPRAGKTGGVSPSGKRYLAGKTQGGNKSKRQVYSVVGEWKFLETALKNNHVKILRILKKRTQIKNESTR